APAASAAVRRLPNPRAASLFRRSTIRTRLAIAFIALGAMSLMVTLLGIRQLQAMEQQSIDDVRAVRIAGELHAAASVNATRAATMAQSDDPAVPQLMLPAFRETE